MGLETGSYIDDLNEAWPLGADTKNFGDDHLRLIKTIIKNSFLGATGIVVGYGASDPGTGDDSGDGYIVGSLYVNTTSGAVFKCTDNTLTAAVWSEVGTGGSGTPVGATMDWPGREADLPTGWYVMAGQTMGDALSGATIADDGLEAAHDILKYLSPNAGTEVWGTDLIELPDTRGRVVIGTDNMGGASANRITATAADTIGGTGGTEDHTLVEGELPVVTPSGSTSTTGNHFHGPSGGYMFGVSTSSAQGASGSNFWATYGRQSWTSTTGNHSHTLSMNSFGSGNAHANVQPYIAMPKAIYLGA